ncbi:MAG: DNA recombination protein RmuC, partial [Euryarchaeota archaeon]|nr:DNA recombination protein RmuC [Euryarchaeota archaeon]
LEILDIIIIVIALGIGFIAAWVARKPAESQEIPDLENLFNRISNDALSSNNEQFLALAEQRLKTQQTESRSDLELRKAEIEGMLKPLAEQIKSLETENKAMEKARGQAYGDLKGHITDLMLRTDNLGKEANNLTTALTTSANVRGNWGEVSLENILEMSNLREGIDYFKQEGQEDGKRPDFIVNIPGGGRIPIDAKATGKKFLEAIDIEDEEAKKQLYVEHARAMKERVKELKSKGYRDSVDGDVEAVVMFVPSEALLAITYDAERDLHEFAMKNDILIASPVSLIALLRTIAFQWRQVEQAENTRNAIEICRELYKRFSIWTEHYEKVGSNLKKTVESFNSSVGTYQSGINPQVKKLHDIRIQDDTGKEIKGPEVIELETRTLPESVD